jgi:hypothetical protein
MRISSNDLPISCLLKGPHLSPFTLTTMAHSHNEFRSLSHYEGYYLDGGDLYFLVRDMMLRVWHAAA